ncbi:MAG: hypothetical protein HC831_30165 [Chloroflexia bacterium]|nr:hypothetical protein [Chloroflexia bacterium]
MNNQPHTFPTIYKDKFGQVKTKIENRFDEETSYSLSLTINGVQFRGSSFDDFELVHPENYSEESLNRFTFNKVKIWNSDKYVFELCNCELHFQIPVKIIDIKNNTEIDTEIFIELSLGNPAKNGGIDFENAKFNITLNNENYISEGDVFEDALVELQNQFKGKYHFKNCFGCLYSDYSPYGNGFFGDLLCFRNCKSEYLRANSKSLLIDLIENQGVAVQETWCCKEFKERKMNTGYRG